MLTLTLSVEEYFKPELAVPRGVGSRAAGSAPAASGAPVPPRLATVPLPQSVDVSYLFATSTLDPLSSSTPDLPVMARLLDSDLWRKLHLAETGSRSESHTPQPQSASNTSNTSNAADNATDSEKEEKPRASSDAPPLRKLKLSLKLPTLPRCYSASHILPKSVRFASRLENVKMFDGRESPAAVSLQNTPLGSPNPKFSLDDYFSAGNFSGLSIHGDDDYSDSDSETFSEYTRDRQYKILSSNFAPPKNLYDKQNRPVYLQSAVLGADKKSLVLLVMCQNLAFEKQMSVKLTLNNWQSTLIFNTFTHVKSFSSVNFDQFKFVIPLAHLPSTLNIQFCIKYLVSGAVHWDNNNTKNYSMVLASFQKPQPVRDTFTYKAPTFSLKDDSAYKMPAFTFSAQPPVKDSAPASAAFAPLAHTFAQAQSSTQAVPKAAPEHNYAELVNKLMSVSDERPKLNHSFSAPSLRPRFSQSFIKKNSDKAESPLKPADSPLKADSPFKTADSPLKTVDSFKPADSFKPVDSFKTADSPLKKVDTFKAADKASSNFRDARFNSSSYAALLQNYCFSGSNLNSPAESLSNSRSNLSSSIASDFMTPASTFHSFGDTIHI